MTALRKLFKIVNCLDHYGQEAVTSVAQIPPETGVSPRPGTTDD